MGKCGDGQFGLFHAFFPSADEPSRAGREETSAGANLASPERRARPNSERRSVGRAAWPKRARPGGVVRPAGPTTAASAPLGNLEGELAAG